jgi:excisionase family DNA binding protein
MTEKILLDATEASKVLSLKKQTVLRLARAGLLPSVKINRLVRFSPEKLREFVTSTERW